MLPVPPAAVARAPLPILLSTRHVARAGSEATAAALWRRWRRGGCTRSAPNDAQRAAPAMGQHTRARCSIYRGGKACCRCRRQPWLAHRSPSCSAHEMWREQGAKLRPRPCGGGGGGGGCTRSAPNEAQGATPAMGQHTRARCSIYRGGGACCRRRLHARFAPNAARGRRRPPVVKRPA